MRCLLRTLEFPVCSRRATIAPHVHPSPGGRDGSTSSAHIDECCAGWCDRLIRNRSHRGQGQGSGSLANLGQHLCPRTICFPVACAHAGHATLERLPATDQFGTQLDPPAHWHQCFPAIDELPAAIALRKLVVVPIVEQVQKDANCHLTADDLRAWERIHGTIPAGSVVMVRSDGPSAGPTGNRCNPQAGNFPE
ncbi:MAG: cyclase family protein [Steroidobacteraceae bacterium]